MNQSNKLMVMKFLLKEIQRWIHSLMGDKPQTEETKNSELAADENSDDKINVSALGKEDKVAHEENSTQVTSKRRRLGMSGPAFSKKKVNVSLMDISQELKLGESDEILQVRGNARQDTILKYGCQKCPEMFFTMEGYHRHLFDCSQNTEK